MVTIRWQAMVGPTVLPSSTMASQGVPAVAIFQLDNGDENTQDPEGAHITSTGPRRIIWPHLSAAADGKSRLCISSHGPARPRGILPLQGGRECGGWLKVSTTAAKLELNAYLTFNINSILIFSRDKMSASF